MKYSWNKLFPELYTKNLHPSNCTSLYQSYQSSNSLSEVFQSFLNRVKDHNWNLQTPSSCLIALEELERKIKFSEVENIKTLVRIENNPHHWLQADTLRIQNFLNTFSRDINICDQTISQFKLTSSEENFQHKNHKYKVNHHLKKIAIIVIELIMVIQNVLNETKLGIPKIQKSTTSNTSTTLCTKLS